MENKEQKTKDIIRQELQDSYEFNISSDFAEKVNDKIDYQLLRRYQKKQTFLIIVMLLIFLIFVFTVFYLVNPIDAVIERSSLWQHKYVPISILSLSIASMVNKLKKKRILQG